MDPLFYVYDGIYEASKKYGDTAMSRGGEWKNKAGTFHLTTDSFVFFISFRI